MYYSMGAARTLLLAYEQYTHKERGGGSFLTIGLIFYNFQFLCIVTVICPRAGHVNCCHRNQHYMTYSYTRPSNGRAACTPHGCRNGAGMRVVCVVTGDPSTPSKRARGCVHVCDVCVCGVVIQVIHGSQPVIKGRV